MEAHLSPRGRCIALIPYYAGARISEVVRLDVGDIQMPARKGRLRLYGKGGKFREVDETTPAETSLETGPKHLKTEETDDNPTETIMKAAIRHLHTPDIAPGTYVPDDPQRFMFLVQMIAGPDDGPGDESFDFTVCTPQWLQDQVERDD
ncbi:Imm8 family immunity protein (plasmid) [Actinomadura sp. ATCC 31491]|uniref:Imm8 family immunity protein n=1 Tax=Actinomadura luzonensis TaxID=2805427 RepID=A0ABT0GBW2_9ACTN|nr:Imm8 family immunity protein [Actinomadura luzonensis]MCK2222051.1 Imm8 family immunity protein [Actinomadura luzonensis]